MGQTTQTISELISDSYRMIKVTDPEENSLNKENALGLRLVNDIINSYSDSGILIPNRGELEFQTVANQREYTFSNVPSITADINSNRIAEIEFLQLRFATPNSVVFHLSELPAYSFKGVNIIETVGSVPSAYLLKKRDLFSVIELNPTPGEVYNMLLTAKFFLNKFENGSDINNIPLGEQKLVKYALARYLKGFYATGLWDGEQEKEYHKLEKKKRGASQTDMTSRAYNYAADNQRRDYNGYAWFNGLGGS